MCLLCLPFLLLRPASESIRLRRIKIPMRGVPMISRTATLALAACLGLALTPFQTRAEGSEDESTFDAMFWPFNNHFMNSWGEDHPLRRIGIRGAGDALGFFVAAGYFHLQDGITNARFSRVLWQVPVASQLPADQAATVVGNLSRRYGANIVCEISVDPTSLTVDRLAKLLSKAGVEPTPPVLDKLKQIVKKLEVTWKDVSSSGDLEIAEKAGLIRVEFPPEEFPGFGAWLAKEAEGTTKFCSIVQKVPRTRWITRGLGTPAKAIAWTQLTYAVAMVTWDVAGGFLYLVNGPYED